MKLSKRLLSLILILGIVFSSVSVFAKSNSTQLDTSDVKWLEVPKIGEIKNKKFEVYGKIQIPKEFKGNTKIKLEVNGFNVVPDKDGSFTKSVFINENVEVKVFTGKTEIESLRKNIRYVVDRTYVDEVINLIDELPSVEDLILDDKAKVEEARSKYDALSSEEKELVNNYSKLIAAEKKIKELELENREKGSVYISLFKDTRSSSNRVDFGNITNVYIRNKETGEIFTEGKKPAWNIYHAFRMDNIPVGEYTIYFEMLGGMYIHEIRLGGTYNYTQYDAKDNLILVEANETNYVDIILKTDAILKEIKPLKDLVVPADITIDDFKEALPKYATIVDSLDKEHLVDLKWDIRPFVFDNWNKPGEYSIKSEFFKLPINVSNTTPGTRLEVPLKVIFAEESTEPYVESVTHDVNHNGNFYRLYNYKNLPEPNNRWGNFYKLRFKFKDGTEYMPVGSPVKISGIHIYNHREAEEIENFDVIIYQSGGQFGPYTEVLTIEDVPFEGPNELRREIFAAATAVGKAEKAKNAGDVVNAQIYLDDARPLVYALPDGPDKDGLLERIQKVQDWIDEQLL